MSMLEIPIAVRTCARCSDDGAYTAPGGVLPFCPRCRVAVPFIDRALASASNRPAWLAARSTRICGSDAGSLAKAESIPLYLRAKLRDGEWDGNAYTRHGHAMEGALLAYADVPGNSFLIRSADEDGFAATPDGIEVTPSGEIVLAQVKTTSKPFKTIPRSYYRQVWWEQYVCGAERTKFIWDLHDGAFDLVSIDPHIQIIERDDAEIEKMLAIARPLLSMLRSALEFEQEIAA